MPPLSQNMNRCSDAGDSDESVSESARPSQWLPQSSSLRQPRGGHVGCFRPPPTVLSTLEGRWIRWGRDVYAN